MLKKYFTYVPMWLCITLNIILGIPLSGMFLYALIYTFGLFSPPTAEERAIGIVIFICMPLLITVCNTIAFFICKKVRIEPKQPEKKALIIRSVIAIAIILVMMLSFFLLPDLWLSFNDWWF